MKESILQHFAAADIEPTDLLVDGTHYSAVYNPDNPAYERGDLNILIANALKAFGDFSFNDAAVRSPRITSRSRVINFNYIPFDETEG